MKNEKLLILGAGLSSLGFYNSLKKGVIYEKESRPGGKIKSNNLDKYFFDQGAHICHSKNIKWLKFLGADDLEKVNFSKGKIINYKEGKIFGYPVQNNLYILSNDEKKIVLKELFSNVPNTEICENYKDWLTSQYGAFLTDKFYKLYTAKYWRTNPEKMSVDWLRGRLLKLDKNRIIEGLFHEPSDSQAIFNYFRYPKQEGFEFFFKNLFKKIPIRFNKKATSLNLKKRIISFSDNEKIKYESLITSIPLDEICKISVDMPTKYKNYSMNLKYLNLIQINLVCSKIGFNIKDFHWMYIYDQNIDISRVSLLNNVNGKDKEFLIQAEIFRRNDEKYNFELLVKKNVKHLKKILKISDDCILLKESKFIKYSYVVPTSDRKFNQNMIASFLQKNNVKPIGIYGNWEYTFSEQSYHNGYKEGEKFRL